MERGLKKTQIRFHVVNSVQLSQAKASRATNADRGRYGPARGLPSSGGAMAMVGIGRTAIARNPRHPKNLYDVEVSMRRQAKAKGKPVKLTPGLSFPDPKSRSSHLLSNPKAPLVCFEFDPTAEDYSVVRNPLVEALGSGERWTISRNINTADYTSSDGSDDDTVNTNDEDDDDSEEEFDGGVQAQTTVECVEEDEEQEEEEERAEMEREELRQYAHVTKLRAHRVMESQLTDPESPPPAFEPQPPPPRAPVQPVLVIPRAIVREESSHHRELRQSLRTRNEAVRSPPPPPPVKTITNVANNN